jgi:hypothetical protein
MHQPAGPNGQCRTEHDRPGQPAIGMAS